MFRIRWLFALAIVAIGCGGRAGEDDVDADVSRDAGAADASSDRAAPPLGDGAVPSDVDTPTPDAAGDARDAGTVDGSIDGATRPDVFADTRDAQDARDAAPEGRDASADTSADGIDVVGDTVDASSPPDSGDAGADVPPLDDAASDVNDAGAPPLDGDTDGGFGADVAADADDGCSVSCGLVSLTITPPSPTLCDWCTARLTATGTYLDNSTRDLTKYVTWSTSNAATAVVSNAPVSQGLVTAMATGLAVISAEVAGVTASTTVTMMSGEPIAIAISPPAPLLAQGMRLPLVATLIFNDGVTADVTSQVLWSSSAPTVASVGSDGVALGLVPGVTTIKADTGWALGFASASLTVTSATLLSMSIAPANSILPVGVVALLRATGHFSDASTQDLTAQASWSSSDATHATVGDTAGTKGRVTAVAAGSATLTASVGAVSSTANIDVSTATLVGIPTWVLTNDLVLHMTLPMRATGNYSDGTHVELTDIATWSSPDSTIAEITGPVVSARGEGWVTASVSFGGFTARFPITVRAAVLDRIDLVPLGPTVSVHASTSMHATGFFSDGTSLDLTDIAAWTTSAPAVAAVGNVAGSRGILTGLTPGTSVIGVIYAGTGATTTSTVTP